jgi:hypothetical protein
MHVGHQKNGRFHDSLPETSHRLRRRRISCASKGSTRFWATAMSLFVCSLCRVSTVPLARTYSVCCSANFLGSLLKVPSAGRFNRLSTTKCTLRFGGRARALRTKVSEVEKLEKQCHWGFIGGRALAGLLPLLIANAAFCQSASADRTISANDMVRAVVANELRSQEANHRNWLYRADREEQGKKKAKEVVQTEQGSLDRLIAVDGHPLDANEQQKERERIENLVRHPSEQQRLEQTKKKDAELCRTFFKMIPDAFTFSYTERDGDLIKLSYHPNPGFQSPSREARVLHDMEGEMWVQEMPQRLVRIRGRLIDDVKFAAGLLGRLEKGSEFNVEQAEVSPGQWELTMLQVDVKGKALFFKTIAVQEREYRSDFRRVPDHLTLAEAADLLTTQVIVAANR